MAKHHVRNSIYSTFYHVGSHLGWTNNPETSLQWVAWLKLTIVGRQGSKMQRRMNQKIENMTRKYSDFFFHSSFVSSLRSGTIQATDTMGKQLSNGVTGLLSSDLSDWLAMPVICMTNWPNSWHCPPIPWILITLTHIHLDTWPIVSSVYLKSFPVSYSNHGGDF